MTVFYGGEKSALLQNTVVQRIIDDRHRIVLDAARARSIELVTMLPVT